MSTATQNRQLWTEAFRALDAITVARVVIAWWRAAAGDDPRTRAELDRIVGELGSVTGRRALIQRAAAGTSVCPEAISDALTLLSAAEAAASGTNDGAFLPLLGRTAAARVGTDGWAELLTALWSDADRRLVEIAAGLAETWQGTLDQLRAAAATLSDPQAR